MTKPKVISLFAGIGGFDLAFERAGAEVVACVEIDKNCRKLLGEKFPKAIIHDDVCTFGKEVLPELDCDVLVGGSPCQSFSVAGLRKGLKDPRGNLTLEYLRVVSELRPSLFVWENVPGVLTDKTGAINSLLTGFEELGYLYDIDILDSQWNGVAQRRRRVFVCGVNVDFLLKSTTDLSVIIMAKFLLEILQNMLALTLPALEAEHKNLGYQNHLKDGIKRRMILLEGRGKKSAQLKKWRNILVGEFQKFLNEQKLSIADHGGNQNTFIVEDQQKGIKNKVNPSLFIGPSWKENLEESLSIVKLFTTLMETNLITKEKIYIFSKTVLNIGKLIAQSNPYCPSFFGAASSTLTTLQEYTKYARQTSEDLFGDMERASYWADFIKQAEHTSEFIGNTRIECYAEILSLATSMQGHPPPSRKKREGFAGGVAPCLRAGGVGTQRATDSRGQDRVIPVTSRTITANEGRGGIPSSDGVEGKLIPVVSGTLAAGAHPSGFNGQDAHSDRLIVTYERKSISEYQELSIASTVRERDHKGATDLIVVKTANTKAHGSNVSTKGVSYTLDSAPNQAVVFQQNCRDEVRLMGGDGNIAGALTAQPGMKQQNFVAFDMTHADDPVRETGDKVNTLQARMGTGGNRTPCVCLNDQGGSVMSISHDVTGTLRQQSKGHEPTVIGNMRARRLTPVECSRLQGFPDNWTEGFADSVRYRMLGNAVTVNVVEWIAKRLMAHIKGEIT